MVSERVVEAGVGEHSTFACDAIARVMILLCVRCQCLYADSPLLSGSCLTVVLVLSCARVQPPYRDIRDVITGKQGSKDIRDVMCLGKSIRKGDGPEEIKGLVKTLAKYTNDTTTN